MIESANNCDLCGKPRQSGSAGSLTQWIFHCRCEKFEPSSSLNSNTIQICLKCGNRIGSGRSGTFTQWIFRGEICECRDPDPVVRSEMKESETEIEDSAPTISEIEVEKEFPLDRFAPIEVLGSTFDTTVYLSTDRLLNTKVAIKLFRLHEPEDIVKFQKEVQVLASLSHTGIVKVLDFAEKQGAPYMVMEYVDGSTLRHFLNSNSNMSLDEFTHVVKSLCDSLSYCHGKNVLHRDIKPENILICADTEPVELKLLDFGLACTYDRPAEQGETIAGTPLYMSPDVGKGDRYDIRSEVYSLGCVLFELLTGNPPYEADTPLQLLKMHADNDIPPLTERSDIDSQLESIVHKCLAKEPDDRYQTMEELSAAVEEYIQGPPDISSVEDSEQYYESQSNQVSDHATEFKQPVLFNTKMLYLVLSLILGSFCLGYYHLNLKSEEPDSSKADDKKIAALIKDTKLNQITFSKNLCKPKYIKMVSNNKELRIIRLIDPTP